MCHEVFPAHDAWMHLEFLREKLAVSYAAGVKSCNPFANTAGRIDTTTLKMDYGFAFDVTRLIENQRHSLD